MADFQTLDLGRILQTAETIKSMRRESVVDNLRQQYLGEQIQGAQQSRSIERQNQQHQDDARQARGHYMAADAVLRAPDPVAAVKSLVPEFETDFDSQHGQGAFSQLSADQVRQVADQIKTKSAMAAGIGVETPEPFTLGEGQARFDSNGRPIAAVPKPHNAPTSYDEFTLAQKDPAFGQFLKSRKGKGISMTMPDGTTVQIGGDEGAVGPDQITNPTKNKLQEAIVTSTDELDRLNSVGNGFDPQFLQVPGRLKGATLKIKDLAGGMLGNLSPDEQDYLSKFSTFKADAAKNLSTILNRLSGAAISPSEGERLKKGIPNDEDSPVQFVAKYRAAVKDSTRAIMRANWALKNGIGVKSVEDLSQAMPLSGVDHVYQDRANEIWQQKGGAPETRQQAVQQANQEFGLAR